MLKYLVRLIIQHTGGIVEKILILRLFIQPLFGSITTLSSVNNAIFLLLFDIFVNTNERYCI